MGNLAVLTCAVWRTEVIARRKLWIFLESAKKAGVTDLHLYGIGRHFPGYRVMMLDWQAEYLRNVLQGKYTHVLFSDGWDAFFTGSLDEILSKYDKMGRPEMLVSAYIGLGNESHMHKYVGCFDETKLYRYPNRGGYIGEVDFVLEAFTRMLAQPNLTGDDCMEWYRGWREGWFRPALDHRCEIFQVADDNTVVHERLINTHTMTKPCIWHLSGGYTDPEIGKDDRIAPLARRLGVIS